MDEHLGVTPPALTNVVAPLQTVQPNLDQKWYNKLRKFWPIAVVVIFIIVVLSGSLWMGLFGKTSVEPSPAAGPVLGIEPYGDYVDISGMVIAKSDDGLILDVGKPEWLKVTLPKGEEIVKLDGKTEVSMVWDQVQQGDIVRVKLTKEEQEQKLKRIFTVKPKSESTNQATPSGN